jgi:hypothetical protein
MRPSPERLPRTPKIAVAIAITTSPSITRSSTMVPTTGATPRRWSRASAQARTSSPMRSGSTLLARKPTAVARNNGAWRAARSRR